MSSSSFPLLRLPSLALKEIIEKIEDTKEQFNLSLCSKRMYYVVKYYRGKSALSLRLHGSGDYTEVCIFDQKRLQDEVRFDFKADGSIYCSEVYNGKVIYVCFKESKPLFSHGQNVIQGTKFLVEFLCDLFEAKIEKIRVNVNKIWLLDYIEELQGGYSYDAEVWNNMRSTYIDDLILRHILLDLNPSSLEFTGWRIISDTTFKHPKSVND